MAENLTPCPFCGGQAVAYKSGSATAAGDDWDVECSECLVTVHGTGKGAIARWNRRVPDAELVEALKLALIEAKREMWLTARHQWTMADFKNWAVIQQIDAALEQADGKPRAALSRATGERPDTSTEPRP